MSMGHGAEGDCGLRIADLKTRSQESESRIQEKTNQNGVPYNHWLLTTGFFDCGFRIADLGIQGLRN
jgi:hypothetical protein